MDQKVKSKDKQAHTPQAFTICLTGPNVLPAIGLKVLLKASKRSPSRFSQSSNDGGLCNVERAS